MAFEANPGVFHEDLLRSNEENSHYILDEQSARKYFYNDKASLTGQSPGEKRGRRGADLPGGSGEATGRRIPGKAILGGLESKTWAKKGHPQHLGSVKGEEEGVFRNNSEELQSAVMNLNNGLTSLDSERSKRVVELIGRGPAKRINLMERWGRD